MQHTIVERSLTAVICVSLVLFSAFVAGCGDSDEEPTEEAHEHGEESPECAAISLVCHNVDGLSDLAKTCHDVGHDNVTADCISRQDECIEHCESLAGAGGHGGAH